MVGWSDHFVSICEAQHHGIGARARNTIYIPPIVRRQKWAKGKETSARDIWCSGGNDRDEDGFIRLCQNQNMHGLRSSARLSALSSFRDRLHKLGGGNIDIVDISEISKGSTLPVIYLKTNNESNPAGLTVLFELLYVGNSFLLPEYCESYFHRPASRDFDTETIVTTREDISRIYRQYKSGCSELTNALSN